MLKKLCWQLNLFWQVRNCSRGGGGAHCKSQFFSRLFPKEVVLRYGCPLLGTHTFKILFLVKGGGGGPVRVNFKLNQKRS